jgi:hypothetical protein
MKLKLDDQAIRIFVSRQKLIGSIATALHIFNRLKCSGGRLYLGSMFYLDFGDTIATVARGDETIFIGELTLSIRDTAWWFFRSDSLIAAAETVTSKLFDQFITELIGVTIDEPKYLAQDDRLEFRFGHDWRLIIDLSNMWRTDEDVLELALPDGRIMAISKDGDLIENAGFDVAREKNWTQSPHRH